VPQEQDTTQEDGSTISIDPADEGDGDTGAGSGGSPGDGGASSPPGESPSAPPQPQPAPIVGDPHNAPPPPTARP
jgi:hypothetical protein